MASRNDYLIRVMLNHTLGIEEWTPPDNLYLALLKTASAKTDTTTTNAAKELETPGENGYARKLITFGEVLAGVVFAASTAQIVFGPSSSDWASAIHAWIVDAEGAGQGNILYQGALSTPKDIGIAGNITFAVGEIKIFGA